MALRSINQLESLEKVSVPLDVRGWEVRTTVDDEDVGKVHDMLVDEAGRPRYLDVDLGLFRKHVLLPVGQAVTDRSDDVVWAQGMTSERFKDIPEYDDDARSVTADYEQRLVGGYDASLGSSRYDRPEYGGTWPAVHETSATARGGATTRGGATAPGGASTQDEPTVMGNEAVRLRRLSELDDYEVADDDPDPRGWTLVGAAGEKIGEVEDLVVDPNAMKARYLDVELDDDRLGDRAEGARLLVPVGYARLDENDRRVRVNALSETELTRLPLYREDFDESYEDRIDRHFSSRFEGEARYEHPRYDADRFYATRETVVRSTRSGREGRVCDVHLRR